MTLRLKLLLSLLVLTLLISLAGYMLANTRLAITGSGLKDGSLSVETTLPNATCRKVLKRSFPFVELQCSEKPAEEQGSRGAGE